MQTSLLLASRPADNSGTSPLSTALPFMTRRLVLGLLALLLPLRALAHGGSHDELPSDAIVPGGFVSNFRLTDHRGLTHELFYESQAKAIVFVFSGTGHPRAAQTATALGALRARFAA